VRGLGAERWLALEQHDPRRARLGEMERGARAQDPAAGYDNVRTRWRIAHQSATAPSSWK
jgi:hypothetical protein